MCPTVLKSYFTVVFKFIYPFVQLISYISLCLRILCMTTRKYDCDCPLAHLPPPPYKHTSSQTYVFMTSYSAHACMGVGCPLEHGIPVSRRLLNREWFFVQNCALPAAPMLSYVNYASKQLLVLVVRFAVIDQE